MHFVLHLHCALLPTLVLDVPKCPGYAKEQKNMRFDTGCAIDNPCYGHHIISHTPYAREVRGHLCVGSMPELLKRWPSLVCGVRSVGVVRQQYAGGVLALQFQQENIRGATLKVLINCSAGGGKGQVLACQVQNAKTSGSPWQPQQPPKNANHPKRRHSDT